MCTICLKRENHSLNLLERLQKLSGRNIAEQMSELKNQVFVYGTLKRGNAYHSFLLDENNGKATFAGTAQTVDKYPLVLLTEYKLPLIMCSPGNGKVRKFGANGW